MENRIKHLETLSQSLNPTPKARAYLQKQVMRYADKFLEHLPDAPAYRQGCPVLNNYW